MIYHLVPISAKVLNACHYNSTTLYDFTACTGENQPLPLPERRYFCFKIYNYRVRLGSEYNE
jgi:hypothetical protein